MRYVIGMLPLGIFLPAFFPQLPPLTLIWLGACFSVAWLIWRRGRSYAAFLVLGMVWGTLWGYYQLHHQLPITLDKSDVVVVGEIVSLPRRDDRKTSFRFKVEHIEGQTQSIPELRLLQLSWYNASQVVRAGERWQLHVRLRSPRGFANPGTFDYQGWLFAEGVSATGYIRSGHNLRLSMPATFSLRHVRQQLLDKLSQSGNDAATGYLTALVLGESSLIHADSFRRLVTSGTVHLMVVSGLHVGIMSALGYWLGFTLGRIMSGLGARITAPVVAGVAAILLALAYTALSGFGLPAQRALLMTTVVVLALTARRLVRPMTILGWTLCLVALSDPLAVIRMGFWLSFAAVAGLMFFFSPRKPMSRAKSLLYAQPVVMLALLPFLVFFQGQISLWMLPVNLLVIPWMSLVVVPLALLGAVLYPLGSVSDGLWQLALWQLQGFDRLLLWVSDNSTLSATGLIHFQKGNLRLFLACLLVSLGLILPCGMRLRCAGIITAIAVLLSRPNMPPPLALTVLDVGQGTAVVVRADGRTLVYDTGAAFSPAFDAGSGIVVPYLQSLGIRQVDTLVVSHADNDHSGGVSGLLEAIPVNRIVASQPVELSSMAKGRDIETCRNGQVWRWHEVTFRILSPDRQYSNDNNNSCVLQIISPWAQVLLPGDIEQDVERHLVARYDLKAIDVLLAPHHGSKTSSSIAFVSEVAPSDVVFSAGFNHHFGHPHPVVVSRYAQNSRLWNTATDGAIEFIWNDNQPVQISGYRQHQRRYWQLTER